MSYLLDTHTFLWFINGDHALSANAKALIEIALPFYHRDPFDRLIIAQSQIDQVPVIGRDSTFDAYGITRHW